VYEGKPHRTLEEDSRPNRIAATLYGTVSASFAIEQEGLPLMTLDPQNPDWPMWNGDSPRKRLAGLRTRLGKWNENMDTDDA